MSQQRKIFIAYADQKEDKEVAFKACEILEKEGLMCWIAPRDIEPGQRYSGAIYQAVRNAEAILLILSEHSNDSIHILAEVELAFSNKTPIFTLRISDIETHPDLAIFIRIFQRKEAFEEPRVDAIREMAKAMLKELEGPSEAGPTEEAQPEIESRPRITSLIPVLFSPFSIALSEIQEQEFNEREVGVWGLDNAIFKLSDLFSKFIALCLLAAYRDYLEEEEELDKKIAGMLTKTNIRWIKLLAYLIERFENDSSIPQFLQDLILYLSQPFQNHKCGQSISVAIHTISSGLKAGPEKHTTILSFLELLALHESEFKNRSKQIKDAAIHTKEAFLAIFDECPFFHRQKMLVVTATRTNKAREAFELETMALRGTKPTREEQPFYSKNWGIENSHILLFSPAQAQQGLIEGHLNLHPFIVPTEDYTDLLIWDHTKRFSQISYESPGGKLLREVNIDETDPFLKRFQDIYKGIRTEMDGDLSEDMVERLLKDTQDDVRNIVTNPLSRAQYLSKLNEYEEKLKSNSEGQAVVSLLQIYTNINQMKNSLDHGGYNKLKETNKPYMLTDEFGGKYIIAKRFFEKASRQDYSYLFEAISKNASDEVKLILILTLEEARHKRQYALMGVEHFMIALSKVCNKLVFDWYDAIGVPPVLHRYITRQYIKKRNLSIPRQVREGHWQVKPRLKKVLNMAVEESNRAKQEEVGLVDCFSAILREGDSLAVRILLNIFDLTHDRLLGEFYNLLRKSG